MPGIGRPLCNSDAGEQGVTGGPVMTAKTARTTVATAVSCVAKISDMGEA